MKKAAPDVDWYGVLSYWSIMKSFSGSELEKLRGRFGQSQSDMARHFDVTQRTWSRWEGLGALPLLVRLALSAWVHDLAPYGAEHERGADVERPKRPAPRSAFKPGYDPRRAK